jgi:transcriptional regulator of arginine metabolism
MNEYSADTGGPRRHEAILALIRSVTVRSQGELQRLLRKRGIAVAQPTLSRDLRELGLAKSPRGYVAPDETATPFAPTELREAKLDRALRGFALSVRAAGSLVVVKTPPAAAQPVARALDESPLSDVVGTIAGDDTVFVATPSEGAARALARRLAASLAKRPVRVGA